MTEVRQYSEVKVSLLFRAQRVMETLNMEDFISPDTSDISKPNQVIKVLCIFLEFIFKMNMYVCISSYYVL